MAVSEVDVMRQRAPRKYKKAASRGRQIAGHDRLSSQGSPAYMQISCRLGSPQRGQVVSPTIRSTVQGVTIDADVMFSGRHHAGRECNAEKALRPRPSRLGTKALRPEEWIASGDFQGGVLFSGTAGTVFRFTVPLVLSS